MVLVRHCICVKIVQCLNLKKTLPLLPSVRLRYFSSSFTWQKGSSPKSNAAALIRLNRENLQLYGPLLKSRKAQKAQAKALLDPKSQDLDKSNIRKGTSKKSVKKASAYSEVAADKTAELKETVKDSCTKQLHKSEKTSSKSADSFPVGTAKFITPQDEQCGSTDLTLPVNWQEVLSDFISKQTLTVSEGDSVISNLAYKNILNVFSIKNLPSVTSILNKTLPPTSRLLLQRWKIKMVREMGQTKFQKYVEELKENGSNFHLYIQRVLADEDVVNSDLHFANEGHWKSLKTLLPLISNVRALETEVTHHDLLYRGKFDCVANYDNQLCLIDWKTSQKHKPLLANTYDNPIQVVAYMSALNTNSFLDVKVTNAVIVVAYPDGSPADIHFMDEKLCDYYWKLWKQRLLEYWTLFGSQK